MSINIKKFLPYVISVIIIILVNVVYFLPQLEGKKVTGQDMVSYKEVSKEIKDYKEKTGKHTLWTNALFGGMPTYQISAPQPNNVFLKIEKVFNLGFNRPIGYFVFGGLSFFLLLLCLGVNPWLALLGSITFCMATGNYVLFDAGHMTKIKAIMASPIILAGMVTIFQKKYTLGWIIFTLGFGINLAVNHYQMTYYLGLLLALFFIIEVVNIIRTKDYIHFFVSSSLLLSAIILVMGTSAPQLYTTYDYAKDTMRGAPILKATSDPNSSSGKNGLAWSYAMNWSNGLLDIISTVHPSAAGGGSAYTIKTNKSEFATKLKKMGGKGGKKMGIPAYFGVLPGTSGPNYMGGLFFFLFLFGAIIYKGRFKWWLISAIFLGFLLSMGKNAEWFNHFLFDNLPLYNKFRAPSSVLVVVQVLFPILGILGLQQVINTKDKTVFKKPLIIAGAISFSFFAFFTFVAPSLLDLSSPSDQRWEQYGLVDAIQNDRASMLFSDGLRLLIICSLAFGLIWFYISGKLKQGILIGGLCLLSFTDLFIVGKKYLGSEDFVKDRVTKNLIPTRAVDQQILRDSDPYYRVLDLSENTYNSNLCSYYHKSIGGYHAAKLQRYQDIIDHQLIPGNPRVINMLNTKYVISKNKEGEVYQQLNPAAMGNAWFINSIKMVNSADEEMEALSSFDQIGEAIVHNEFKDIVKSNTYNKSGTIVLTNYAPDELSYKSNTQSNQFAVFSDIWYGPDKGWKAYIDGKEVEYVRTNYILRGMDIPAGSHEIRFTFHPDTYYSLQKVALISSFIFLLIALGYFLNLWRNSAKPKTII